MPTPTTFAFNPLARAFDLIPQDAAQIVTVGKSGTMFTTIQGALDSILDASTTKRYVIVIFPGTYTENVTLKNYVYLKSQIVGSVIINGKVYGNISGAAGMLDMAISYSPTIDGEIVFNVEGTGSFSFLSVVTGVVGGTSDYSVTAVRLACSAVTVRAGVVQDFRTGTITKDFTGWEFAGSGSFGCFDPSVSIRANYASGIVRMYRLSGGGSFLCSGSAGNFTSFTQPFSGSVRGWQIDSVAISQAQRNITGTTLRCNGNGGTVVGVYIDSSGNSAEIEFENAFFYAFGFTNSHRVYTGSTDTAKLWLWSENASFPDSGSGLPLVTPHDEKMSGFLTWGDSGPYWSYNSGTKVFTLLRRCAGIVDHAPVDVHANQTVTLTDLAVNFVYADSNGTLQTTTTPGPLYEQGIITLFQVWVQGTNYTVAKENHPFSFASTVSRAWHNLFGSLLQSASQSLATNSAANRTVNLVGNNVLTDHGLDTDVLAQTPVTWIQVVTGVDGKMYKIAEQTGIVTRKSDLTNTTGTLVANGRFIIYRVGVIKDSLNSSTAQFICHAGINDFANAAAARNAIAAGTVTAFPAECRTLELCQLGFIVIQADGSGGGTIDAQPVTSLQVFGAQFVAGGTSTSASLITTNTANFNGILSGTDTNVQLALDTLDDMATNAAFIEGAQDAVGTILTDSTSIDFTYTDATPSITATVKYGAEPGAVSSSSSGTAGTADTASRSDHSHDLGTHSHTDATNGGQISSGSISDFTEAAQDAAGAMATSTPDILFQYSDAGATLTPTARRYKNYVLNPDCEIDETTNVTNSGFTVTRETSSHIYGTASFKLVNAAGASDYVAWSLATLDSFLLGKPLFYRAKTRSVSGYTSGNFYLYIYDGTAEVTGTRISIPTGDYEAKGFFVPESGKTYTLRVGGVDSNGIYIDMLAVDEQVNQFTNVVTDWQTYTPTCSWASNATATGKWRRVGDSMEVMCRVNLTGTTTTANLSFSIPSGYTIDTTKQVGTDVPFSVVFGESGSGNHDGSAYRVFPKYQSSTTVVCTYQSATTGGESYVSNTAPVTWDASDYVEVSFMVPIVGWSSNIQVADRALEEYAWNSSTSTTGTDSSAYENGPQGAQFYAYAPTGGNSVNKDVRFQTAIQPTDRLVLEIYAGGAWRDVSGSAFGFSSNDAGTTYYGMELTPLTSTTARVQFYSAILPGGAWSGVAGSSSFRWRVRKISSGGLVGYPVSAENVVNPSDKTAIYSAGAWTLKNASGVRTFSVTSDGNLLFKDSTGGTFTTNTDWTTIGHRLSNSIHSLSATNTRYNCGTYFDDAWKASIANTAGSVFALNGLTSDSSTAFEFRKYWNGSNYTHSADATLSSLTLGAVSAVGAWTLGPSGFTGKHTINGGTTIIATSGQDWLVGSTGASQTFCTFRDGNSVGRGSIVVNPNDGTTTYNTTSDYRLKHDVRRIENAISRVLQLNPCTFRWKENGRLCEGFIAHELAQVCPIAVSGEKDAITERGDIIPQGIDPSKVVALLTAAIQEQQTQIEALKAEIAALKGA